MRAMARVYKVCANRLDNCLQIAAGLCPYREVFDFTGLVVSKE